MNPSTLHPGIYPVRIKAHNFAPIECNLSVRERCGIIGVATFRDGEKPPRKHLMLTEFVREWIERMEIRE